MKKNYLLFLFCILITVFSKMNAQNCQGYDIILVAGQSNTHYGYPLVPAKDTVNSKVYALKRYDGKDYRIEKANPALDFWTRATDRNSFAITFANLYAKNILANSERKILIIPAGYSGTSIAYWVKNANLYKDAMERTNYVLDNIPGSKVVAILWHQGEANVGTTGYQTLLDKMISDMRSDIKQQGTNKLKFILGGFVPFWANAASSRQDINTIIKNTPSRVAYTGFANPTIPFVISKPNNYVDDIHFDSDGQREMGKRYYEEFVRLNNLPNASKNISSTDSGGSNEVIDTEIKYFPNPTTSLVNIESSEEMVSIEIYSSLSKVMEVKVSKDSQRKTTIDLSRLTAGTYYVHCITKTGKTSKFSVLKN